MAAASTSPQSPASDGSALCTACGLCCAGALHRAAVLDPDEVARAAALGLPVLDRDKPGFALPCPKLEEAVCQIYGERPRVCSRYRCALLQRLDAGDVGQAEAQEIAGAARTLVDELRSTLPESMTLPEARALVFDDSAAPSPAIRLAVTAVTVYIDKHFRNAREGKFLRQHPLTADQAKVSDD